MPSGLYSAIQPSLLLQDSQLMALNTPVDWNVLSSVDADPMEYAFFGASFPSPDPMAPISWNDEFSLSSHLLRQDETIISISSAVSNSSPSSLLPPVIHSGPELDTSSNHLQNSQSDILMSFLPSNIGSTASDSAQKFHSNSLDIDFSLDSSSNLIFARDFHPNLDSTPQALHNQLLATLCSYPSLLLQRDHWSPFVHHRMYRCSLGEMAKPMGLALACVSAHAGSSGSNYGFVDSLINQEREQLVWSFSSFLDTPEHCLAALHAVCVYQILGLFGDNFLPAAVKPTIEMKKMEERRKVDCERQAGLHSSFLLKMARRLSKHYHSAIQTTHDNELNWERWKFAESIRRNIFFANIINILGAHAGKLSSTYFEPLDDELILNLPLPAPECMWRACSLRDWLEAKTFARSMSLLDGDGRPAKLTSTLKELLNNEEDGRLDVAALLPLTRVVLASVKIAPAGTGYYASS